MFCVFLLFFLALSCDGQETPCLCYFASLRSPLHHHYAPEGKTWQDWNTTCDQYNPGYGLLQRKYKEASVGAVGSCANVTVPLGLLKLNGTVFWAPANGVKQMYVDFNVSGDGTYGSYDMESGHVALLSKEYPYKCAVCEMTVVISPSFLPKLPLESLWRQKTHLAAAVCPRIESFDFVDWNITLLGEEALQRDPTSLELIERECACVDNASTPVVEDVVIQQLTFWKTILTTCIFYESCNEFAEDIYFAHTMCLESLLHQLTTYPLVNVALNKADKIVDLIQNMFWYLFIKDSIYENLSLNIQNHIDKITRNVIFTPDTDAFVMKAMAVADLTSKTPVVGISVLNDGKIVAERSRDVLLTGPHYHMTGAVFLSESLANNYDRVNFIHMEQMYLNVLNLSTANETNNIPFNCCFDVSLYGPRSADAHNKEDDFIDLICVPKSLQDTLSEQMVCSYWILESHDWSSDGCFAKLVKLSKNTGFIHCRCNQTAMRGNESGTGGMYVVEYAVDLDWFVASFRLNPNGRMNALNYIALIGSSLSVSGLVIILLSAILFENRRQGLSNKILHNVSVSLVLNYLALNVVAYVPIFKHDGDNDLDKDIIFNSTAIDPPICIAAGAVLHYALLVSFFWMLVMSYLQLLRITTILGVKKYKHALCKAAVFSWGVPLIIVVVVLAIDPHLYTADLVLSKIGKMIKLHLIELNFHWISIGSEAISEVTQLYEPFLALLGRDPRKSTVLYTYKGFCYPNGLALTLTERIPILSIIFVNVFIFIAVILRMFNIFGWGKTEGLVVHDKQATKTTKRRLKMCVYLFFLLGIPWTCGYIAMYQQGGVFAYFFSITVSLQGFVLFIYMIVLNKKARESWNSLYQKLVRFINRLKPTARAPSNDLELTDMRRG